MKNGKASTDLGLARKLTQDAFSLDNHLQLWVLADGMGGHAGGEVASNIAIEAIPEFVQTHLSAVGSQHVSADQLESLLRQAIESANKAIRKAAAANERLKGMGTTIVAVAITHNPTGYQVIVGHVGDSRAYLIRHGTLSLWTIDHSLVEERLALNLITPEQARKHPLRHVLTKALGIDHQASPTIQTFSLEASDQILLCSDGLTKMLTDQEIQLHVTQDAPSTLSGKPSAGISSLEHWESICRTLMTSANRAGGEDNTTVVLIGLNASPNENRIRKN